MHWVRCASGNVFTFKIGHFEKQRNPEKSNVELFCKRTNCGEVMATGLRMEAAIFQIVAIFPDFEIVGWAGLHKIAPL